MTDERVEFGLAGLAKMLGKNERTIRRKLPLLLKYGAINKTSVGRPPRNTYMWFPSTIKQFLVRLSGDGKKF